MENYSLDWLSDPTIYAVNRERQVSSHKFYSSFANYKSKYDSDLKTSLNGQWKIKMYRNHNIIDNEIYKSDYRIEKLPDITVPGHIQLQGYDRIHYTNTIYPWDGHEDIKPPEVPNEYNPVGVYFKDLNIEHKTDQNYYLKFDGVEVAFYLFINNQFVGYSEDSFTPSCFEVSKYIKEGKNRIVVQVHKFSTSSWLEDQDFWRFSGIFRDVILYTVPEVHIEDLFVKQDFNENYDLVKLTIDTEIIGAKESNQLSIKLIDKKTDTAVIEKQYSTIKKDHRIECEVKNPKLWSAEFPNLYELLITIEDSNQIIEVVTQQVGFREVKIDNGVIKVNGKRVVFKGVNRHEFNYKTGRVVTEEDMKWDIQFLKKNNFNAVRTSHYPNVERWYELCDEYGIYVIDEANLETHGTWQKIDHVSGENHVPGNIPEWHDAVLDRGISVLERDKNYPSIIMWSCGNESFSGTNILSMAQYFRERDPRRIVHYEGVFQNREYDEISDVESRMYAKVSEIIEYLENDPKKPFINCEYSHAMGNSCGNIGHYSDLEDIYPMYQGGFIWDYIDQGLEHSCNGTQYIAYGGDFGDRPTDFNFCINGIVYADRKESPKVQEIKKVFENVKLEPNEKGVLIKNRNLFDDLSERKLEVKVLLDGKIVSAEIINIKVDPLSDKLVHYKWPKVRENGEVILEANLLLGVNEKWANSEHILSWGQKIISREENILDEKVDYQLVLGDANIGVKTENIKAMLHKQRGLVSLRIKGKELITSDVPHPNIFRPLTDNDRGCHYGFDTAYTIASSYFSKITNCEILEENSSVSIIFDYKLPHAIDSYVKLTYEFSDDGMNVHYDYKPGQSHGELSMHGVVFKIPNDYDNVTYYGGGPKENYIDRNRGAKIGIHDYRVVDNVSEYVIPQESGNRTKVRYVEMKQNLRSIGNFKIKMIDTPFEFKALPYGDLEIEKSLHTYELKKSDYTYLTIAGIQRGVGGDDSWGAPVLEEYRIDSSEPFSFSFRIEAF